MNKDVSFKSSHLSNDIFLDVLPTDLGKIVLAANESALLWVKLTDDDNIDVRPNEITQLVQNQLKSYFEGHLTHFDIPFDFRNKSEFSVRVWQELLKIPYGATINYQQLAQNLGNPLCIRAAATANGRNPFPIIIPCHRVIGKNGHLTGYALGVDKKKYLLDLERKYSYGTEQIKLLF